MNLMSISSCSITASALFFTLLGAVRSIARSAWTKQSTHPSFVGRTADTPVQICGARSAQPARGPYSVTSGWALISMPYLSMVWARTWCDHVSGRTPSPMPLMSKSTQALTNFAESRAASASSCDVGPNAMGLPTCWMDTVLNTTIARRSRKILYVQSTMT